jgi:hypothetical protein
MRWLEKPVRYKGSDCERNASQRGVVGFVADRAQVYCPQCAEIDNPLIIGEIYAGSQQFQDNLCDGCNAAIIAPEPKLMMFAEGEA